MSNVRSRARVPRPVLRAADLALPQPATLTPGEAARLFGVSTSTLAAWADRGHLTVTRSPGGRRSYDRSQVEQLAKPRQEVDLAEVQRVTLRTHNLRVAAAMSEAVLQSKVLEMATRLGWRTYHTYDSRRSQPGFPDLTLLRGPVLLFRELKTERGQTTKEQQDWLEDLAAGSHDAGVWRPLDLIERRVEKTLLGER